jgi:sulfatase modifying factor 1
MRTRALIPFVAAWVAAFAFAFQSRAQSPLVTIDTVKVGDAGNAADTTGYGAVTNVFAIGKYEVTLSQYTAFLNAVAATDTYNLYNTSMASDLNIAGISRTGSSGSYVYSLIGPSGITPTGASSPGNRPVSYVSWFDAARFANWMHNGATNGASTETGAYTLNGATNGIFTKNPDAKWWIPSENEWYKAAYYKGGGTNAGYWLYPTRSDSTPGKVIGAGTNQANYNDGVNNAVWSVTQSGTFSFAQNYLTDVGAYSSSGSYYGTYDQGGNVFEWNDAVISDSSRSVRGGNWGSGVSSLQSVNGYGIAPVSENKDLGFRVASVAGSNAPRTNVILAVKKASSLTNSWQLDREINVGPMTNTNEFYKLEIRTVVE